MCIKCLFVDYRDPFRVFQDSSASDLKRVLTTEEMQYLEEHGSNTEDPEARGGPARS